MGLFFCEVLYLVDNFLILALSLDVDAYAANGADDATDATAPEESVVKGTSMKQIGLVQEPTHPQNDGGNAKQQPVGLKLLGAGHFLAGLHEIMVHQTRVADFTAVVEGGTCTDEHEDAGDNPEEDGEA